MERVLQQLEPQRVFHFFEDISRIPRESGNEKEISDYLVRFAKERGLEVVQDAYYNVVISKPATPGYEDRKPIMFQGHIDMVCVKEEGVEIDFAKDPIPIYVDGDFVKARGTSLGADDGHAVAMALALLDNDELKHPAMQCIFSATEETTMAGAENIDASLLKGEYLIGLDWSLDDTFLLSCGGSSENHFALKLGPRIPVEEGNVVVLHLQLQGTAGGHSGKEIGRYGANGVKLMGELLAGMDDAFDIGLIRIDGGNQTNVIAEWAKADICCRKQEKEAVKEHLNRMVEALLLEYKTTDPELTVTVMEEPAEDVQVIAEKKAVLTLLDLLPNGVYTWMDQKIYMAKCSMNIGNIRTYQDRVEVQCLVRSNSDHDHDELLRKLQSLAKLCGADYEMSCKALAWDYIPDSHLQQEAARVYEQEFGQKPGFVITHAQTETGIFIQKMKEAKKPVQALNIGVRTFDVHSTRERMQISSVGKTYRLLCALLENIR